MVDFPSLYRTDLDVLQVNLGYRCNQRCLHCHHDAGPERTEMMDRTTVDQVLDFLLTSRVKTLDLTGGAPELHSHFRHLIRSARALGVHVIDRCNLTVLEEPEAEGLEFFLAEQGVEIIASLPCYLEENVDHQRGKGTFQKSLRALKRLNHLGYGKEGSGLALNLVYNPLGPFLPPSQTLLEQEYRKALWDRYGIVFNRLYALANMPIRRFNGLLTAKGVRSDYLDLLRRSHCQENLASVMCRSLISVDYQGYVYDCDFNQALGLPIQWEGKERVHLSDLKDSDLRGLPIRFGEHCFGCTAGQGSSCTGSLR
ncbi:MAG: arsenosugar biosynthesis radical SAM protein ArsS [Desulfobacterota bacterium]|nr:arsenosugar biosynthesis radical SAM protein ArsS [Thermodesulfobacteriota bacterium]